MKDLRGTAKAVPFQNIAMAPNSMFCLFGFGVGEDFGGEGLKFGAVLPGIGRQTGFQAGLGEEGVPVPSPLDGDLGQQ